MDLTGAFVSTRYFDLVAEGRTKASSLFLQMGRLKLLYDFVIIIVKIHYYEFKGEKKMAIRKLEVGDELTHKVFGPGKIIGREEDRDSFVIDFSCGRKVLLCSWVQENCSPAGVSVEADKEKARSPKGFSVRNESVLSTNSLEDVHDCMTLLRETNNFPMDEYSWHELECFFGFMYSYSKSKIETKLRYNLLIQSDETIDGFMLAQMLHVCLMRMKIFNSDDSVKFITERDILSGKVPISFPESMKMLVINRCGGLSREDSVAIVSSSYRSELQKEKREKDEAWEDFRASSIINPSCVVIACGDKSFVDYLRHNDEMYYRFFAHHVYIQSKPKSSVRDKVISALKKEGFKQSVAFVSELTEYIRVVYPKADLRGDDFIKDLVNRILVDYFVRDGKSKLLKPENIPFYRTPRSFESITRDLDKMIGLQKVKASFRHLHTLSREPAEIRRLHFAFVGNPGTGKTTVAKLTAELLFSMGLIKKNKLLTIGPADVFSSYVGESSLLMKEKIDAARGGVLFIDEAYFLAPTSGGTKNLGQQCLQVLLGEMENHPDNLSVIFAGYPEDIDRLLETNPGLRSRVPYRFEFEDFTDEELYQIFEDLSETKNISIALDAEDILLKRLQLLKTEDGFGNARSVQSLFERINVARIESGDTTNMISAANIESTMPMLLHTNLDEMIGLTSIKHELLAFESRVKYIKFLSDRGMKVPNINLHMMFTGNPGTGKTTVARMIADILFNIGILKSNRFVVAERKDLIADHIGGTAQRTQTVINKAMNGVLFIDEAYSLVQDGSSRGYGPEAITTLITAMEEHKSDLVVILAGYSDEMEDFVHSNPGIASRIGFTFNFPDYTPLELVEIYVSKMARYGFTVTDDAAKKVYSIMEYYCVLDNFGNGRFVDKIIDMSINLRSQRAYGKYYSDILEEDIPDIDNIQHGATKRTSPVAKKGDKAEEALYRTAVHEAGHAVVGYILSNGTSIRSVSISEDAMSFGRVASEPITSSSTEDDLKIRLCEMFGGRNAERLLLGSHTSGCSADIKMAKRLAKLMVEDFAMGELGKTLPLHFLVEADQRSAETLEKNKDFLLKLAALLLTKTIVSSEDLAQLCAQAKE